MKTKTAWLTFAGKEKITCTSTGEKDPWGKEIWRDSEGKAYELKYARLSRTYAFCRYPGYDPKTEAEIEAEDAERYEEMCSGWANY